MKKRVLRQEHNKHNKDEEEDEEELYYNDDDEDEDDIEDEDNEYNEDNDEDEEAAKEDQQNKEKEPQINLKTNSKKNTNSHSTSTSQTTEPASMVKKQKRDHNVKASEANEFEWKENEFDKFSQTIFKSPSDFFGQWNYESILANAELWQDKMKWISLYIIANDHEQKKKHASIGRVRYDLVETRIRQHNGKETGVSNKALYGHCKLVFFMTLPPVRNFSSVDIKKQCGQGRGWISRCVKAIQIAFDRRIPFCISRSIFDSTSNFYSETIEQLLFKLFLNRKKTEDDLRIPIDTIFPKCMFVETFIKSM